MQMQQVLVGNLLVSEEYLSRHNRNANASTIEAAIVSWRAFLVELGVTDAPRLEIDEMQNPKCSAELAMLMTSRHWQTRKAILECIDRNWTRYAQSLSYTKGGRSLTSFESGFSIALRTMETPSRKKVALTPTELATALQKKERYWLCVVEFALDANRRSLYLLRNPFGLTQQFRYDSGWKSITTTTSSIPLKPDAGLFVEIDGEGKGQIISAKKLSQFYKLQLCFLAIAKFLRPTTLRQCDSQLIEVWKPLSSHPATSPDGYKASNRLTVFILGTRVGTRLCVLLEKY